MIFCSNESVEDAIIRLLSEKEYTAKQLLSGIPDTSLQAVYKALKQLEKDSSIIKQGKKISLNKEWARNVAEHLTKTRSFPSLEDRESVSYVFQKFSHLDQYWKHITLSIHDEYSDYPVFFYEPHEFWIHLKDREESQKRYLNRFKTEKRHAYFVIGGNTELDKKYRRDFQNEYLRIDISVTMPFDVKKHITIIGDFIITTFLNETVAEKIHQLYKENSCDFTETLNLIFNDSGKIKLKIERNKTKAQNIRKKLSTNFVIPLELQEKFELF